MALLKRLKSYKLFKRPELVSPVTIASKSKVYYKIIIIFKTNNTGPSGKNKIVHKLLSQPHKDLRQEKMNKHDLRSYQRLTAPLNSSNVPVSNVSIYWKNLSF